MIPELRDTAVTATSVPRMCGDDPTIRTDEITWKTCSPHVRG